MNLGAPEILLILVVALMVFGPHRLPEIGRQIGGALRELRRMQDSVKTELHSAMQDVAPPQYDKPVSAPLPGRSETDAAGRAPGDEPDHAAPALPGATASDPIPPAAPSPTEHTDDAQQDLGPTDPGFDGPSGSFQ